MTLEEYETRKAAAKNALKLFEGLDVGFCLGCARKFLLDCIKSSWNGPKARDAELKFQIQQLKKEYKK